MTFIVGCFELFCSSMASIKSLFTQNFGGCVRKPIIQMFSGNLISKFLGLLREILTAAFFGTGQDIGAYRVAQTGTLVPINFLTSDSLNSAFVPQYKKMLEVSRDHAQTLFWSLVFIFFCFSAVLCSALWGAANLWVAIIAPGLNKDTSAMAVDMLRVMGFGIPFYLMSALLIFLGMANDDFVPMAVRSSIQNIGLIGGAFLAFILNDAIFLAWGFSYAYVIFSIWVLARTYRAGKLFWPKTWTWVSVKVVVTAFVRTLRPLLMLPVMLQGNIAVERAVASLIGLSVVSGIDYAKFLSETLILLVSVPIAFAGLGHWSTMTHDEMDDKLKKLLIPVLIVAVPVSFFLMVNSDLVVEVIYSRGAFDVSSVMVTGDILFGISVGLWAQVLGYVLIKALNAQLRNGVVLKIMTVALLANALCNIFLYPYLGALTLGLGNSVYGLVLLGGALSALRLWKAVLNCGWGLSLAAFGYLLAGCFLPQPGFIWNQLLVNIFMALVYWVLFVLLVPDIRKCLLSIILPKLRESS